MEGQQTIIHYLKRYENDTEKNMRNEKIDKIP